MWLARRCPSPTGRGPPAYGVLLTAAGAGLIDLGDDLDPECLAGGPDAALEERKSSHGSVVPGRSDAVDGFDHIGAAQASGDLKLVINLAPAWLSQ